MPPDIPSPLPLWILLSALVAILAVGRYLAWHAWRIAAGRLPPLWRALGRLPGLRPLELHLSRRWPRATSWSRARIATDRFAGLPLTLAVLLMTYLIALMAGLIEDVLEYEEIVRLDDRVNETLAALRDEYFVRLFYWITGLGDIDTLIVATCVALALFWAFRRPPYVLGLMLAWTVSTAVTWSGKYAIDRDRPEALTFAEAASPSFPSGHTTGAMAVYGFIAYAVARELGGTRRRFETAYWALALIALIAFSRMILSVHYFSDIVGGLLVGAFGLVAGVALSEWQLERGTM